MNPFAITDPLPDGGYAVLDTRTGKPRAEAPRFCDAIRLTALLNQDAARQPLPAPCCGCSDRLDRAERAAEHYRVVLMALARDGEDRADPAIQEAERILRGGENG